MVKIIIVTKNTTIKESNVKFDIEKVYKYAGLKKTSTSFNKIHTWNIKNNFVSLFANVDGKAGNENKYEIPPPKDNDLFYGSLVLVYHSEKDLKNSTVLDLDTDIWEECYNELYGGFEDLNSEETLSDDDIPEDMKTSGGYMKSSFVVDDDEPIEYGEESKEEEEEEDEDEDETDEDYEEMSELSEDSYSDTDSDEEDDEDEEEDDEEDDEEEDEEEEEDDEDEDDEDEDDEDDDEDSDEDDDEDSN